MANTVTALYTGDELTMAIHSDKENTGAETIKNSDPLERAPDLEKDLLTSLPGPPFHCFESMSNTVNASVNSVVEKLGPSVGDSPTLANGI